MDPISKAFADWKLPIGKWGKSFIDFIIEHFQWFFDAISATLQWSVENSSYLLLQIPPLLLAAILAGIAYWLQRSKWLALGVFVGLVFILNQGLWKETVQTLVLVSAATALSMAIGVPLGISDLQSADHVSDSIPADATNTALTPDRRSHHRIPARLFTLA